jgi:hemolysin activation/secretion protein
MRTLFKKNIHALIIVLLIGGACNALAQSRPDAGGLSTSVPDSSIDVKRNTDSFELPEPASSTQSNAQSKMGHGNILIKSVTFDSDAATHINEKLKKITSGIVNKIISMAELQATAGQMERLLQRNEGLLLAKVWVPIQEVKDGALMIRVLQGTAADIRVDKYLTNKSRGQGVLRLAEEYVKAGDPLTTDALEQLAFRSIDYIGSGARIVLVPSAVLGTYTVLIEKIMRDRFSGIFTIDNTGNKFTNQWHETLALSVDDATGHSDQIQLTSQVLTPNQKIIKIRYQLPTEQGLIFGADAQYTKYKLCCGFADLKAQGSTHTVGIDGQYNIVRTRSLSSSISITAQHRRASNQQLYIETSGRQFDALVIKGMTQWSGEADHSASLALTAGRADLTKNAADVEADTSTAGVSGNYQKLAWSYSQLRPLTSATQLRIHVNGQWAKKNMDSSEKMSLGGMAGVRAYPYGEGFSDIGLVAQLEVTTRLMEQWQLGVFFDYGYIQRNAITWAGATDLNDYALKGAGISTLWQPRSDFSVQTTLAFKLGRNPGSNAITRADSDGKSSRLRAWLTGTWIF